jgi:hypothetical protein
VNTAELNEFKYLKPHAQVLLDKKDALDNLWFLAQEFLAYAHNLSANYQIIWKISE